MSLAHKFTTAAAVFLLIVAGIIFSSWLAAREEGIRLKATLDAQAVVISDAGKREATREAVLKESIATLENLKNRTQTPTQVIERLPQLIPLPQPITLNLPAALANADPARAGLKPNAPVPQDATIPAADLKPLFDFAAACKECQAKVTVLQQDKADDQVKIGALVKERDAAVTAAKGGSKWARIKRAGKWLVIGGGIGAAALCGSGHCK